MKYKELTAALAQRFNINQNVPTSQWPARFRNASYALSAFRRHCKRDAEDATIGPELGDNFEELQRSFLEGYKAKKRGAQTLRDKKSLLMLWRHLYLELRPLDDVADTEGTPFMQAIARIMKSKGISCQELAREVKVPTPTLHGWLRGATVPTHNSSKERLARLEAFAGCKPGELLRLYSAKGLVPQATMSAYRQRVRELKRQPPYWLPASAFPQSLRDEYLDLVQHKHRAEQNIWTGRPIEEMQGGVVHWYNTVTSRLGQTLVVPTANILWSGVVSFLSFLCTVDGGPKIQSDTLTLALLVKHEWMSLYVEFMAKRSGGSPSSGVTVFIGFLVMLTKPVSGYLASRPALGIKVGITDAAEWAEKCEMAHEAYSKLKNNKLKHEATQSRQPFAEIDHILQLDDPLRFIKGCFVRMKEDLLRAEPGSLDQAIKGRDLALATFLFSNPLRARQVANLEWHGQDANGNYRNGPLRRLKNGGYGVALPAKSFKNYRGAQKDQNYEMELSDLAAGPMHDYLTIYRPRLLTQCDADGQPMKDAAGNVLYDESKKVFVSSKPDGYIGSTGKVVAPRANPWSGLNRCVEKIAADYFGNGFGPHTWRDLVATIYLRMRPGEYLTVAKLLHDTLETVLRHYSRFDTREGFKLFNEVLDDKPVGPAAFWRTATTSRAPAAQPARS